VKPFGVGARSCDGDPRRDRVVGAAPGDGARNTEPGSGLFQGLGPARNLKPAFRRQGWSRACCTIFLPGTIAGSILGALLSRRAPKNLLLGLFAAFLVGAGVLMMRSGKGEAGQSVRRLSRSLGTLILVFSFAVGVLSSLIGVGGGLVIFPFLVL